MQKTVLLIAGPTAVGKTALALQVAHHFHTSIISADSRQCYREISIGVAKPSPKELEEVQHYFIHSHGIQENLNAAAFEQYALEAVTTIFQQHEQAVMVGGTGLYIKAFTEGMDLIPAVEEKLRNQLQAAYQQNGLTWLQQELQSKDPLYAAAGEMQNPQRMLRALEVVLSTGQSILHFRKGEKQMRPFKVIKIGLDLPREILYQRINQRVEIMMQEGLLEEAKAVYHLRTLNALQTVGYRELFDYFDGTIDLNTAIEQIKQNSRHYAKRQLTWFKRDQEIKWFHPEQVDEVIAYFEQAMKKPES